MSYSATFAAREKGTWMSIGLSSRFARRICAHGGHAGRADPKVVVAVLGRVRVAVRHPAVRRRIVEAAATVDTVRRGPGLHFPLFIDPGV